MPSLSTLELLLHSILINHVTCSVFADPSAQKLFVQSNGQTKKYEAEVVYPFFTGIHICVTPLLIT